MKNRSFEIWLFRFAIFLVSPLLFAQNQKIDSLQNLLAVAENDSIKTAILVELCWQFRNSDVKKAEQFCKQAEEIAQKKQFNYLLAKAWNHLGLINHNRAFYAEALVYYYKAVQHSQENSINDQFGYACQSIANVYIVNNERDKEAFEFIQKSFEIFNKQNNAEGIAYSHLILGKLYAQRKNEDSATVHYEKALSIWQNNKNENAVANVYYVMSIVAKQKEDYEKAHFYLNKAFAMFNRLNNVRGKILIINEFADIDYRNGKLDSALLQMKEALIFTRNSGITELVETAYKQIAAIYERKNDYAHAHRFEKLLIQYKDSIQKVEKQRYTLSIEAKYALDKKNEDIQRLEVKNQIKENTLYLLIILIVALFTIGFLLYKNINQKQKTNLQLMFQREQIKVKNDQLSQLNEEITLQKEEQEKLNIFKNKLFSIISHDLRNPLASLKGALFLFKSNLLSEEERGELVDKLSQDLQASSYLLDNMLNWTKAQMEGLKMKPVLFPASEIIVENFGLLKLQASQKQITLESSVSDKVQIYADVEMTKTVIRNVLHNAIKYSFLKGKIEVSAETDTKHTIIAIKDYGRGMSKEAQEKLFGSHHFSTAGTSNEKGSGLGLLLAKDFVEKNEGSIWVKSIENAGSTFFIKLPNRN
jgi:two-component system, sensor histidine kinase and response regulator